ncbi:hypothetical protein BHE74_00055418 [Ensete ventricosum]|nr:hypothetical protein BHE74_00055418 [Ensete ventricosum]
MMSLLSLLLTMSSYLSTPAVLAVRRAPAGKGVDLNCARLAVRPLTPPYLRQTDFPRRVGHVGGPVVQGREDVSGPIVGMISSDSLSSVRVFSSPGSEEASRCDPEVGSSGASSGPPSPIDAKVLKDLEVMKADHDLDTTVTEGSLAVIRERYSIQVKYGLHVP